MIKFFRRIRQDLLNEGKTTKYFKYAVGEIALVVIGILIALSINNKNAEISKKNEALNFYSNTKQQLLDDGNNFKSQVVYNNAHNEQFGYAINIIELNDRSKMDSLAKIAMKLIDYSDFDRQGNIYESMVNSGDIKLLKNDEIIERLRRLEETYIYVNRMENIHFDAVMSIIPELSQTIRLNSKKVENVENLYGFKFQNLFALSLRIIVEKEYVYNRALSEIESIVQLIEIELE